MPKVPGSISFLAIDYQGLDYLYLDSDGQGRDWLAGKTSAGFGNWVIRSQYSPRRRGDTEKSRGKNKVKSKYKIKPENSREHRDSLKKSKTINHRGQATGEIGASGHRDIGALEEQKPLTTEGTEEHRGRAKGQEPKANSFSYATASAPGRGSLGFIQKAMITPTSS